jgi:AraC-like DNA-binding protein
MVSLRCKMIVRTELDNVGLTYGIVDLGEVEVENTITPEQRDHLKIALMRSGLELMDDKKAVLIEKIKTTIIEMIHYEEDPPKTKNSEYISNKLGHNYTYLASLFSEATGTTIEHCIISHKIERAKELIIYNELNLTEIAWKLNYSSVAHLSNQFKKITGLTPTFFKNLKNKRRTMLEDL